MAWKRFRKIEFDHEPEHKYPYVCVAWREVGGMNCGDRFTEEVGQLIIEACREDGIEVVVNEVANATPQE